MILLGALVAATLALNGGADGGVDANDAATVNAGAGTTDAGHGDAGDGDASSVDAAVDEAPPPKLPAMTPVARVVGQVLAMGGREVVPDAALIFDRAEIGTTDERGDFAVELPCGVRSLRVQAAGFEPLITTINACATVSEAITLRLVPTPGRTRRETVVKAAPSHPQIRLTGAELTQTPGALGDPLRVIESLPGVAAVAWPAPIYAVRGSNPGNTGFFLDGIQIPALFHFALGPSVIHPYFFRSLDFFPGSYPAKYGRYVGGIVTAETRAPAGDELHMSVDARLYDAGAMVSAPIAGGAVAVAARYSYTGELISLLDESIRLQYWDYQLRVDRRFGPLQLSLLAFGSNDAFSSSTVDPNKELDLGFHRVSLRAALPVAGGLLQGSIVVGTDHSRAPVLKIYPIIVDAKNAAPRLSYQRGFGPVTIALGFDGQFARYEPIVLGGAVQPAGDWDIVKRRDATSLAGYASATISVGRRLTVTPELRFDSYDVNGTVAHDLGPRLAASLAINDETTIRATGGHFTQLPSLPLELPGVEGFGLRLLGLQTSWQGSVGVETTHFAAASLSVTGFVQHAVLTDLRNPSATSPDPLADDFLARREALAYGVELLARRALTQRLHGWISYTLSNSLRAYGGGAVGPASWDQRHILNFVAGYRIGRNIVGARLHFNTGRPEFLQDPSGEAYRRLPAYYQLDLRVDRPIYYNRFTLNFYAELVNATANTQVYGLSHTSMGEIQEQSYRIVLPSIGVRAEF
ncbi:MAG: TonB-dependent receptor plug domain-containing protein [Polyangia bacterium]